MVNMKSNTDAKPSKNDVDAPATRERVLLEAARLFRHHGYSATTLREVADAAGVKAGSIYYHFESKEQILGEVLDKGITIVADAVRTRIGALPESALWRDRIAAGIEGHLWGMLHYGDFTSANIRIYGQIPTSAKKSPPGGAAGFRRLLGSAVRISARQRRIAPGHQHGHDSAFRDWRIELDRRMVQPPARLFSRLLTPNHSDRVRWNPHA